MQRNEILALVMTAAIMALALVGFLAYTVELVPDDLRPEQYALQKDAPAQVQQPASGAVEKTTRLEETN